MSDMTRVEFDVTLEEIVDVDMRLVMSTKTYRRGRRQSQWIVGVIIAGVVAVALQDHLPLTAIAALTASPVSYPDLSTVSSTRHG